MKIKLLLLFLFATIFCSCSNNDNEPEIKSPKNPLIGSWELSRWEHIYGTGDDKEISSHKYVYACEADFYPYLIFEKGGTATAIHIYGMGIHFYELSYVHNDNNIIIEEKDEDGDVYILTFNVEKLTNKELVISVEEEHEGEVIGCSVYYYEKKEFVEKSINELVLGEWELDSWDMYDWETEEWLDSGGDDDDNDTWRYIKITKSICEFMFYDDAGEVWGQAKYMISDNSLVLINPADESETITFPIERVTGKDFSISRTEYHLIDNEDIKVKIVYHYNKK